MSRTYGIGCCDCRKKLWIGQGRGSADNSFIYSSTAFCRDLCGFFFEHRGHRLLFDEICIDGGEMSEFQEIEAGDSE